MTIESDESRAANRALAAVPAPLRGFWAAHFQYVPNTGRFVGLVCKICNRWQDAGHDEDCPVAALERCHAESVA